MCGAPDGLTGCVVAYLREEPRIGQGERRPGGALAKVEDFGHIDLAGHYASLQDARGESTGVVEFVIDEVAVSLDQTLLRGRPR
jgi:hypothetical protein